MNGEELEHQKNLVELVFGMQSKETLDDWAELTSEDYWISLAQDEDWLQPMALVLKEKGVNTDSIKVMNYVNDWLGTYERY